MELLERFALGDLDAFEALFRQFQGAVYGWIIRIVRDHGAAEDLTVETFWRIYRARGRFDPARSFGAWARRVATNLALDHLKAVRRQPMSSQNPVENSTPPATIEFEVRESIQRAFRQLPAKLQVVATLAIIEEASHAEIAEALGISMGAVKSRQFRAVRLLQKKLKHLGVQP
jgi:RNA polymerase sigma factor (sigma-70 family)